MKKYLSKSTPHMSDEPLKGKTFVITGVTEMDREEATLKVIELGGRCTKAVSGKTTYLVIGNEPGPSKVAKAKELGVKIIEEEEFQKMLSVEVDTEIVEDKDAFSTIEKIDIEELSLELGSSTEWDNQNKNETYFNTNVLQWSEKYRPRTSSEIVGNQAVVNDIKDFVRGKLKDKCIFITGSPGLGKTTAVQVVCKENNVQLVEFNGSDVRNKKSLIENVKTRLGNKTLYKNKRIILMDEVDGMTSDRGGLAELNLIIKQSDDLFICIANDRSHPKLKTLLNNSHEIKFRKPLTASILPRLKSILKTEGSYLPDTVLTEICIKCNQDMRYILNTMQRNKDIKNTKELDVQHKDIARNTFEVVAQMFKPLPIKKKIELFFEDYSFIPLFIHDMYIKAETFEWGKKKINKDVTLEKVCVASEHISFADVIDSQIHGTSQNYTLLPAYGVFSCVMPGKMRLVSQVNFPSYLGKMSRANSIGRILAQNALNANINIEDYKYYACVILHKLVNLLEEEDIKKCAEVMAEIKLDKDAFYDLLKMYDIDVDGINKKVKGNLTRELNKIMAGKEGGVKKLKKTKKISEEESDLSSFIEE